MKRHEIVAQLPHATELVNLHTHFGGVAVTAGGDLVVGNGPNAIIVPLGTEGLAWLAGTAAGVAGELERNGAPPEPKLEVLPMVAGAVGHA